MITTAIKSLFSPARTSSVKVTEGTASFSIPDSEEKGKTWYKTFGDLSSRRARPLVVIHGGPGVTHTYMLPLAALASSQGIPVIFYDQLGSGLSTHLRAKQDDPAFWTEALFLAELQSLLAHLRIERDYALLGHSWGGMLAARHAAGRPPGLKRLVLANALTSMRAWSVALEELRADLPAEVRETLQMHEAAGTIDAMEYRAAVGEYARRHVCRVDPMPEELVKAFASTTEYPGVFRCMYGPTRFTITGTLSDWSIADEDIKNIQAPTLLVNGRYDESKDACIQGFFDHIPDVTWVKFAESSHTPQFEEREKYLKVVGSFLLQ